ncbi:MAG: rRNA maturation RNase YbeY [Candidatus Saccharicenans sp.]|nr:rRNA maturation RNase YbeY [Candidatus Saccharicenans sp.]MDI6850268.1 rRNA maturation RNase YbeY [Candidatus Saccharicenans sp.]
MVVTINKLKKNPVPLRRIKDLLQRLSRSYGLSGAEVVLTLVGPRAIRSLNRKYRHKDRPTDVLSFSLKEKGPDGKFYLGDIIICPEVARRQARKQGHSLLREIEILTIHGFLHLLGFEHFKGMEEEEARARARLLKNYREDSL